MITINCETKDSLAMEELTEFQGELKHREESDIKKIAASIIKHGFAFPFFVWSHDEINHVFDGHGRLLALKYLKSKGEEIPNLPVVYINAKNEAEAKEMLLKLNSHYGKMTTESVIEFLDGVEIDFDEIALPDTFMDFSVETEPEETEGDDEVPEVQEEAVSQPGEMYQLGDSILMCGDSTNEEDVARLMGGVQADLVVTDPPYNVAYEGKTKDKLTIENDKMDSDSFRQFLIKAFNNFKNSMKEGAVFYIWYANIETYNFVGACKDSNLDIKSYLIWNKNSLVIGRSDYQWKHEPCLYGWKEGAGHAWYSDRKQTTIIDCKRPTANKEHPTMKPVELFEYQIKNSSKGGGYCSRPFWWFWNNYHRCGEKWQKGTCNGTRPSLLRCNSPQIH